MASRDESVFLFRYKIKQECLIMCKNAVNATLNALCVYVGGAIVPVCSWESNWCGIGNCLLILHRINTQTNGAHSGSK